MSSDMVAFFQNFNQSFARKRYFLRIETILLHCVRNVKNSTKIEERGIISLFITFDCVFQNKKKTISN